MSTEITTTQDKDDCVFCEIIEQGDYHGRDFTCVWFAPLNPVTPGHMLFVPIRHVNSALDSLSTTATVFAAAALYAQHQNGEHFNLITSSGSNATQTVNHFHVHYVPRVADDGLHLPWTG